MGEIAVINMCCILINYYISLNRPLRDQRCKDVNMLPFPVEKGDGHYKTFNDVYRTDTEDVCI